MNSSLTLNSQTHNGTFVSNSRGIMLTQISWVDYFIFIMMLAISFCIGIYGAFFGKTEMTLSHYLTGGKKMGSLSIAISLVACHLSTFTLLAVPAEVYQYGANYLWTVLSLFLMCLLKIYIYLPVLYNLNLTSIYEYLEERFDAKTRLIASFLYVLQFLLFLAVIMYIAALACHTVSGFNVHVVVITVCVVCIFYTMVGGLKSIVWVDVFQMVILTVTVPTFLVLGVIKQGGPSVVWSKVKNGGRFDIFDFDPNPTKRDSFWIIVIGTTISWLADLGVNQSSILKYSSVPTFSDCKKTAIFFTIGLSVIMTGSIIQGLNIYAFYSDCDPVVSGKLAKYDGIVAHYVMDIVKDLTGFCGLFMAGVFSASLSSLSTTLNSLSGVIYKDFISKLITKNLSEAQICNVLKLIVLVTGTLCILLIFVIENLGGLFQVALNILSLADGPQLGIFSLGLLIPRANSNGAFYGAIGGLISGASLMSSAQYYRSTNLLQNPINLMSTAGCSFNQTVLKNTTAKWTIANTTDTFQPNFIFRISFFYYPLISASITMFLGIVISYLTNKNQKPVDRKLISPLCHSLMPPVSSDVAEGLLMQRSN